MERTEVVNEMKAVSGLIVSQKDRQGGRMTSVPKH
jgi:hypothetical protein